MSLCHRGPDPAGPHGLPFHPELVDALLARSTDADRPGPVDPVDPVGLPPVVETAAGWGALGVPPGSPIVLAMPNGLRMLHHYFAALLAGLVPMPVSAATPALRVRTLAARFGAAAVMGQRADPGRLGGGHLTSLAGVPALLRRPPDPAGYPAGYPPGTTLLLTSGTSGPFSACLHPVASLVRNARRHAESVGLRAGDSILVSLPLHYSFALVAQAMAALVTGGRLILSGPPFTPAGYLARLTEHRVTSSSLTPPLTRLLLAGTDRLPRGLRMLTVGGDASRPAEVAALLARHRWLELYLTYGLTEAGPRVSTLAAHAEPARRHASVGAPLRGVSAALRATPGTGDGAGELLVRTDTAMLRRVGMSAGDGPADRNLVAPGVLATGDLFRIDEDGYLFFQSRISDFVVLGGEKVCLAAVRRFVQDQPGVVSCATRVGAGDGGTTHYDLDVTVTGDPGAAGRQLHAAMGGFLLAAERPRSVRVEHVDALTTHK
ncbi:MAG: acyl--CoA ligase [Actinobacteria bacterium]|nr:acyl--CoA ligase [Actinomycetota bacterium]